jgi:hypothetical protein
MQKNKEIARTAVDDPIEVSSAVATQLPEAAGEL